MNVVPHVAQIINEHRGSAIDARTTRHPGYAISQRIRKRVEEIFGWAKTVGGFRRTRYRGRAEPSSPLTWSAPPTTWSGSAGSCQPHEMGAGVTPHLSPIGATGERLEKVAPR